MIQPVKEKIILGIDPGTTIMGYGVLRVKGTKPEMIAMGIIDLRKFANHYLKLRHIHERVFSILKSYLPDELAIEAPFFGKNVQSMLKLGRAQDVYKRQFEKNFRRTGSKSFRSREVLVERRSDHIYSFIRTLCRKDYSDQ